MNDEIKTHLDEAYRHLNEALQLSVQTVKQNKGQERPIAVQWETFLGGFFRNVRQQGKENKLNLLSIISFAKLMKG
jgi:hypothetical protein